jgi:predicted XRE-type DNA-binding protein
MTNKKVTPSTGNVFADLELENADELLVKAELALRITQVIKEHGLTQIAAAKMLGIDQPKVSRLVRGELYGFSTDQLMRFLNALGHDIEIVVRNRPRKGKARGKLVVQAA